MTDESRPRVDSASRVIRASPMTIYRACMDPVALVSWLPPGGMTGAFEAFEPWEGGRYRMVLAYHAPADGAGKTTELTDVVDGRFLELRPGERIVQLVDFESDDPAFAGAMRMTWTLTPAGDATEVAITAENVPPGIRPEDHDAGMTSTLDNLARYVE